MHIIYIVIYAQLCKFQQKFRYSCLQSKIIFCICKLVDNDHDDKTLPEALQVPAGLRYLLVFAEQSGPTQLTKYSYNCALRNHSEDHHHHSGRETVLHLQSKQDSNKVPRLRQYTRMNTKQLHSGVLLKLLKLADFCSCPGLVIAICSILMFYSPLDLVLNFVACNINSGSVFLVQLAIFYSHACERFLALACFRVTKYQQFHFPLDIVHEASLGTVVLKYQLLNSRLSQDK
ncbi:Hypothetical_protein [Hexamita inflata]|uniref:Hypothetical_protein n=1 Tax=Hexamita inflata TaxID=28002 RepID=A0AA86TPN0_9EUKA|nr:Hypothetical protein HINF_LOCUS11641 [Hexamita inflata]